MREVKDSGRLEDKDFSAVDSLGNCWCLVPFFGALSARLCGEDHFGLEGRVSNNTRNDAGISNYNDDSAGYGCPVPDLEG